VNRDALGRESIELLRRYLTLLDEAEWRRVHGADERISPEKLREGVRGHAEMLLEMAAA
jgi:hypothetical protein